MRPNSEAQAAGRRLVDTVDIAWCAEACPLAQGTVCIAIAPYRQQIAALDVLAPELMTPVGSESVLQDTYGNRIVLSHIIVHRPFQCVEVKPGCSRGGCRSVTLTCRLEGAAVGRYLRRLAAIEQGRRKTLPLEAGFVGTSDVPEALARQFFAALPRVPMSAEAFQEAMVDAVEALAPASGSDLGVS
jgi:hypothetical protein